MRAVYLERLKAAGKAYCSAFLMDDFAAEQMVSSKVCLKGLSVVDWWADNWVDESE